MLGIQMRNEKNLLNLATDVFDQLAKCSEEVWYKFNSFSKYFQIANNILTYDTGMGNK